MIPEKVSRWRSIVDKWCLQLQISQSLVLAVIQMESGGDPDARRHEPAYEERYVQGNPKWEKVCASLGLTTAEVGTSYGLMQMMFATSYGYGCKSVEQALDPDQAVRFGAAHLAMLLKKYSTDEALAAYNGGTGAVSNLRNGRSTPATRYSGKVMTLYDAYRRELAGTTETVKSYFEDSEFACKCGCGFCKPDPRLVLTLNTIREAAGKPIIVNSCCRCPAKNKREGGKADSAHLRGEAADIYIGGWKDKDLGVLIKQLYCMNKLPHLRYCYLIGGKTNTAVHVGVDDRPRSKVFGF